MITITTVNYNTSRFIQLLLYSLQRLTFNNWQIIIADNNSDIDDFNNLRKIITPYPHAVIR